VADSSVVTDVVRARPRKATAIARVMAGAVVVIFTVIGVALHGKTDAGTGVFGRGDQVAMIGLGILGAAGILLFTRPRVEADARGIRVRNVIGGYELPWEVVRSIQFGRGAPWATLELQDDDLVSVMAVQAADKQYALATVRSLRLLLAAHQSAGTPAD
jgi:PH (Pleckstrin Homology) domain-containing protein